MRTVVFHGRFEVSEVLGCFDIIYFGASQSHEMGMEFLPFERVCDQG